MRVVPIELRTAKQFIAAEHRHSLPPKAWRFGAGLVNGDDSTLVGVGVAGRPKGRGLQDGTTIEIVRTCTDGTPNANSMLYGALCRAAKALGYRRAVTYNLSSESGTSLKAAGFVPMGTVPAGRAWNTPSRPRVVHDMFGQRRTPIEAKVLWERTL